VELWASDGDVVTCEQAAAARSLLTIEPILTTRDKEVRPDGTARGAIEPPQRVLVVDGDPESRAALSSALNRAGYEAEQVTTGEEALEAAHRQRPAIVIMETHLGGASGYEICREFREQYGDALPIIFVSAARTEATDRVAGLLLGADEYLAKPIQFDHLLARVRRLMAQSSPAPPMQSLLTPREQEVLSLLEEGLTPEEMASRLVVTPKTVAKHIEHILGKLGVHSRAQAVALALRRGPQRPS
jgi:two-component system nitrate/nitrite response regulator NarL